MAAVGFHRCGLLGCPPVFTRCAHHTDGRIDAEVVGIAAQIQQLFIGDAKFVAEPTQPHRSAPQPAFDEP